MSWLRRARFGRWVHFLALPLAGFDVHAGTAGVMAAGRGVLVAFAVLAFGYTLNALSDRSMDRPAKGNAYVTAGATTGAFAVVAVLGAAALLACSAAPTCARIATGVSLTSGVAYSIGPRLKRFPVVGSLVNLTNFVPLMWVGASDGGTPRSIGMLATAFACLLLQNQLIHEAADRGEDDAGGLHTSVMLLGPGASGVTAAILGISFVVAAATLGLSPWLPSIVYVVAVPLLLARSGRDERKMARLRVAHRVASVVFGAALFVVR